MKHDVNIIGLKKKLVFVGPFHSEAGIYRNPTKEEKGELVMIIGFHKNLQNKHCIARPLTQEGMQQIENAYNRAVFTQLSIKTPHLLKYAR